MTIYQSIILVVWLLFGITLVLYLFFNEKREKETFGKVVSKEKTSSELSLSDLVIEDFKSRKMFKAKEKVNNGFYAEINSNLMELNNVLNITNSSLPNTLEENAVYISINQSEYERLRFSGINTKDFEKFTPGTYVKPGYYLEVNIQNMSTDYVIKTERRLPPTKHKGFRWVKIDRRKLK